MHILIDLRVANPLFRLIIPRILIRVLIGIWLHERHS